MSNDRSKSRAPVLNPPAATDRDWEKKIAIARAAREHGKALRADKPVSFRSAVGRSR